MASKDVFREAVSNTDIRGIRLMMKNSLLVDPSFREFNEMSRMAENVPGLYDAHDGHSFEEDSSAWNDDYMNQTMVQVVGNFSKERLEHLKKVVRKLRPVSVNKQTVINHSANSRSDSYNYNPNKTPYQNRKEYDKQHGTYRGAKIAAGAVAGAVIGGGIAAAVSTAVIGGVAIGAAVGGVAVALITDGK
jgi:hypothetical protein